MKLGLIIPYRDRLEHLDIFIPYITKHLKKHNIDYKIVVVEQCNKNPFNRSKLMNIGAKYIYDEVDYLCFHDVDLIPDIDVDYNIYDNQVIHLCGYLIENRDNVIKNKDFNSYMDFDYYFNKFKFRDFTKLLFLGGVTIIRKNIWKQNKWNEIFQGWGCEDDEYYHRLKNFKKYDIYQSDSRFISLNHKSNARKRFLCFKFSSYYKKTNSYIFYQLKFLYSINKKKDKFLKFNTKYKILKTIKNNDYDFILIDFDNIKIDFNYFDYLIFLKIKIYKIIKKISLIYLIYLICYYIYI